mmetsp:Transcript_30181/g.79271  ORF Transcript_30181/g.79271 Transcript_30181/m.79271 type:complete len:236 (+) Transcript_30181:1532-2239(+)
MASGRLAADCFLHALARVQADTRATCRGKGRHLSVLKRREIKGREGRMLLDRGSIGGPRAEAVHGVAIQEAFQQPATSRRHPPRKFELAMQDELIHFLPVLAVERREPHDHLIRDTPERPPIHRPAVRRFLEHLWRKVLWGATEGPRSVLGAHPLLAQSKVSQHDVAILVQQNVFGLEVAVQHVMVVKKPQRRRQLGGVKQRALLRKLLVLVQVEVELASVDIVEHKVQFACGLE